MGEPTLRELAQAELAARAALDAARDAVMTAPLHTRAMATALCDAMLAADDAAASLMAASTADTILAALDAERAAGRAEVIATVERLTRESVARYYADRSERNDAASDACGALCEAVLHEWPKD